MKIIFKITSKDKEELSIVNDFCNMLVSEIKSDILNNVNYYKLSLYEDSLIKSSWIIWKRTPRKIDMKKLVNLIVDSIVCTNLRKGRHMISVDNSVILPNSYTSIERVARFLDRGNELYNGTFFISKIFMKYQKRINDYWKSYVSLRLRKITVSEVVTIV